MALVLRVGVRVPDQAVGLARSATEGGLSPQAPALLGQELLEVPDGVAELVDRLEGLLECVRGR
eukprot:5023987-Lingulodinium_polyedra.AAC.1